MISISLMNLLSLSLANLLHTWVPGPTTSVTKLLARSRSHGFPLIHCGWMAYAPPVTLHNYTNTHAALILERPPCAVVQRDVQAAHN